MSWSTFIRIAPKREVMLALQPAAVVLNVYNTELDHEVADQVESAKRAALELLKTIPGPFVGVTMSGHANGVGWHNKDGYATDFITVTVTQNTVLPQS